MYATNFLRILKKIRYNTCETLFHLLLIKLSLYAFPQVGASVVLDMEVGEDTRPVGEEGTRGA